MRIAITGSRDAQVGNLELTSFEIVWKRLGGTVLLHGNCPDPESGSYASVDQELARWARSEGVPVEPFNADWTRLGRAAGPIRNGQMVRSAGALIAFEGGRGTAGCVVLAQAAGIPVYQIDRRGIVSPEWPPREVAL